MTGHRLGAGRFAWPVRGEVVLYDTEFTAWEGSHLRDWSEPWEHREIIEIGAVRTNAADFSIRRSIRIVVRPAINPVLSDYIRMLTGITQAEIARDGVDFATALDRLDEFADRRLPLLSNGDDGEVLAENAALNGVAPTIPPSRIVDIRAALAAVMGVDEDLLTTGKLPAMLGLPFEGRPHRGLSDARALAAALAELRRRGAI